MTVRKSINQISKTLTEKIDAAGVYYLDREPAELGNYAGDVVVPNTTNMVYARMSNGQVVKVFNTVAPAIWGWKVYIGRDKSQPSVYKILDVRWIYNLGKTFAYVLFHHLQHEYPGPDTVWVRRDQFMPLLVLPAGGMHVTLYGDIIFVAGMTNPIRVPDIADIDLSGYAVSAGAQYLLLEVTDAGTLNYVLGNPYVSIDVLRASAPFPTPTAGNFPICVIELFESQTEIRRDSTVRNIIDLRMFVSNSIPTSGEQVRDAPKATVLHNEDSFGIYRPADGSYLRIPWLKIKNIVYDLLDELRGTIELLLNQLRADSLQKNEMAYGDLTDEWRNPKVSGLRGMPIDPKLNPADLDSLVWDATLGYWRAGTGTPFALTMLEQDSVPTVVGVTSITVSNGTLTDMGGGLVSLTTGGGGGGGGADPILAIMNALGWA